MSGSHPPHLLSFAQFEREVTGERIRDKVAASKRKRDGELASFNYARIYAQLGDKTRAFAALDRAWEVRDSSLLDLKIDPYLDPLRSDPRYASLVKRLGLPA